MEAFASRRDTGPQAVQRRTSVRRGPARISRALAALAVAGALCLSPLARGDEKGEALVRQAGDRLQGDLRVRADEVEARLALGFSGREAVQPMARTALRAAMIPTVNGMMTVGLVQLPGMMTGQILAGSSPLLAIKYQLVVVFMQAAATALASLLFVRLAVARFLTPAHQLRRYLL